MNKMIKTYKSAGFAFLVILWVMFTDKLPQLKLCFCQSEKQIQVSCLLVPAKKISELVVRSQELSQLVMNPHFILECLTE